MRDELKGLDDLEMGDLWQQARSRTPRTDDDPDPRASKSRTGTFVLSAAVLALMVFIVAALLPLGDEHPASVSVAKSMYTDPSGWTANYPSDWTVSPIDQTSDNLGTGVTISNVAQPGPLDAPTAVFLTVTHALNAVPDASVGSSSFPLSVNDFKPAPGPSGIALLEFRVSGLRYLASMRVGPSASQADSAAMDQTIASVRPVTPSPSMSAALPSGNVTVAGVTMLVSSVGPQAPRRS